ncbi:MAG TPA: hypothetical protein VMG36_00985, partial [Thermoplasmata archaeon]|nr:hypothetical protein [Thermoplasmata archaeon]
GGALILEIIPRYWDPSEHGVETIDPDGVYRPFLYIHAYSGRPDFALITRTFIANVSAHLEGCLQQLSPEPPKTRGPTLPFGALVTSLKESGKLPAELAARLRRFNECLNVPAKHPQTFVRTRRVDERTFSVGDAASAFMVMRELSLPLFQLMADNGVQLKYVWPDYSEAWSGYAPSVYSNAPSLAEIKRDAPRFG